MKKLGCLILCLLAFGFGQKEGKPLRSNKQLIQINEMESMEDSVVPKRLSYQGLLTKANGQPVLDGDYQIGGGMLHRYSAGIALKLNNATIQELHAIANSSTGNIHSMYSFNMVIHAKRGDTLHIEGEKHGGAWSNIILSKLNG